MRDESPLAEGSAGGGGRTRQQLNKLHNSFDRWYAKPPKQRRPMTQQRWGIENGVHEVTIARWAKQYRQSHGIEQKRTLEEIPTNELKAMQEAPNVSAERRELIWQELEWRALALDKARFITDYCWMLDQEGGDPIPFDLWEPQREALKAFDDHRHLIVLKTRRLGFSWLADAYCLHTAMWTSNVNILFRSIGREEATEQHDRLKFMYDHLPDWMQDRVQLGSTTGRKLKRNDSISQFSNGSAVRMLASTKRKGHGSTPKILFWDEQARDVNAAAAYGALKAAVGAKSSTKIIIVSTSDGPGNLYHKLWLGAVKKDNTFHPLFFPASRHPDYSEEFLAAEKREYEANGELEQFYYAYPMTPAQAFAASSKCPFPSGAIDIRRPHTRDPKAKGEVDGGKFVKSERGRLVVWQGPIREMRDPRTNKLLQRAHDYAIGVDVAEGLANGDFSAFVVLDVTTNRVVARFRGKVAPESYADPIEECARWYNDALVGVEMNKFDTVVQDLKLSYDNLFMRERRDKPWNEPTLELGWYTSAQSKKRIVKTIRAALLGIKQYEGHPIDIPDELMLDELSTFQEDGKGGYNAPKGEYDDTVIALGIALCIADQMTEVVGLGAEDAPDYGRAYDYSA